MSGFCGWFGFDAADEERRRTLERMRNRLIAAEPRSPDSWIEGPRAVAAAGVALRIEDDAVAAIAGRPYFDDSRLTEIAADRGAAAAVLHGFRERGVQLLGSVRGAFSLAVVSRTAPEVLLAVDRIGGRYPLTYKGEGERLIFSTHGAAIQAHPQGRSELDPQGIFNYLYFHVVPGPGTAHREVRRLQAGTYLHLANGSQAVGEYWRAGYDEGSRAPLADLEAEFMDLLRQGVRRCAEGQRTGCFLSGGTDSSTVVGLLGEVSGEPPRTYSIGFDAPGYDEMEFARCAVERFGAEHHEYYVKPDDIVRLIPRVAEAYATPFGNESVIPSYYCARMGASDGVEQMLGGDGGDELFAGNQRYAKQQVFEAYGKFPTWMRRALIEPLVFGIPGGDALTPVRKARSYIRQAKVPMPERGQAYNYLERLGVASMLDPDFLASVDPGQPLALLNESYHATNAETALNRMLAMSLRFTLADNDLPKVSRMCELAGVSVAYPLLTDELVEFSSRLPVGLKMKGLRLRWFFKHALRDFLPQKILTKSKHGFGLPFGLWVREHAPLREIAMQSLQDLKSRSIVRADFIEDLLTRRQQDHAVYFGVLVWVLMVLEQWCKVHVDRPVAAG